MFVDEIHRFNKAQQDAFLPYVESGVIILIGATTENPSFEVIGPLLSRCKVYVLNPLQPPEIEEILRRALADDQSGLGKVPITVPDEVFRPVVGRDGDARIALNIFELAVSLVQGRAPGSNRQFSPPRTWNPLYSERSCNTTKRVKSTTT